MSEDAELNEFFSQNISEHGGSFDGTTLQIFDENQKVVETVEFEG